MHTLEDYGWSEQKQRAWNELSLSQLKPARVIADFGTSLTIVMPNAVTAELSGKLAHYTSREDTPKVGDWVAVKVYDNSPPTIEMVVLRANTITRKVAGKRVMKQIIAANIDLAFVLLALDDDFSVERLQRFLYQLSANAIESIIVLNKADKTEDIQHYLSQLDHLNLPILITTATEGAGVETITARISSGCTAILLGSSGVGKSTLTNRLLGRDAQTTNEIRESDSTGKHTTVHRELFMLPSGGMLIDTPGIRELQLWGSEEDLDDTFKDVLLLTRQCRYNSCQHTKEQDCAIKRALDKGTLDKKRYRNFVKMKTELLKLAQRQNERHRMNNRRHRSDDLRD